MNLIECTFSVKKGNGIELFPLLFFGLRNSVGSHHYYSFFRCLFFFSSVFCGYSLEGPIYFVSSSFPPSFFFRNQKKTLVFSRLFRTECFPPFFFLCVCVCVCEFFSLSFHFYLSIFFSLFL